MKQRRVARPGVIAGFILLAAALAMHTFTKSRIAHWQPGYPRLVELGPLSPPPLLHELHILGPLVAGGAALLVVAGAWFHTRFAIARFGTGLGVAILVVLVLLYAWATTWVFNVSRQVRPLIDDLSSKNSQP
jgi:hypothetical protein